MRLHRPATPLVLALASTAVLVTASGVAQERPQAASPKEPPLADTRLTPHTLVREDIFAGFLADDMKRFERGERNVDRLLEMRPEQKGNLLAWKAGSVLYRAVRAHEANKPEGFKRLYRQAVDLFAQAEKEKTSNQALPAIQGGSYAIFADRLPQDLRPAAWERSYQSYSLLAKAQESVLASLPVHHRGEVLGGLALAAARTGRAKESAETVDRMLTMLRDTPYEPVVKQWKATPGAADNPTLACLSCHEGGRLEAKIAALGKSVVSGE